MRPAVVNLADHRQHRQERAQDAVLDLFSQAFGKKLVRRELTPAERQRREMRQQRRERLRSSS